MQKKIDENKEQEIRELYEKHGLSEKMELILNPIILKTKDTLGEHNAEKEEL